MSEEDPEDEPVEPPGAAADVPAPGAGAAADVPAPGAAEDIPLYTP